MGGLADSFLGSTAHAYILTHCLCSPVAFAFAFTQFLQSDTSRVNLTCSELFRWLLFVKEDVVLSHFKLRYSPRLSELVQWNFSRAYERVRRDERRTNIPIIAISYHSSLSMGQCWNVGASSELGYDTLLQLWRYALNVAISVIVKPPTLCGNAVCLL